MHWIVSVNIWSLDWWDAHFILAVVFIKLPRKEMDILHSTKKLLQGQTFSFLLFFSKFCSIFDSKKCFYGCLGLRLIWLVSHILSIYLKLMNILQKLIQGSHFLSLFLYFWTFKSIFDPKNFFGEYLGLRLKACKPYFINGAYQTT